MAKVKFSIQHWLIIGVVGIFTVAASVLGMVLSRLDEKSDASVIASYKLMAKKQDSESPFPKELTADFMRRDDGSFTANGPVADADLKRLLANQKGPLEHIELLQAAITPDGLRLLKDRRVKRLGLNLTELTPEFARVISTFSELETLSLSDRSVTDQILCELKVPQLKRLDLHGARITSHSLACLADNCPVLTTLNINGVPSIDDSAVPSLKRLRNLESLNIGKTSVSAKGVNSIVTALSIQSLAAASLSVDDACVEKFPIDQFTDLDLSGNSITDASLRTLSNMPRLSMLRLVGCTSISDNGVRRFKRKHKGCTVITSDTTGAFEKDILLSF